MSDWYPQVAKIEKIEKHPNADTLSVYTVLGDYPVIDRTDKYAFGDNVIYIPIDTIVPDTDQFYFLCPVTREQYEEAGEIKSKIIGPKYTIGNIPEKYRIIKAKKIRGIYSMGMLLPNIEQMNIGDSVIDVLSLKKWEEEVDDNIPNQKFKGRNQEKPPKGWSIPYYDIEGLRKYKSLIPIDEDIVLLEKINGSNGAFIHDGERLWVKSRNFFKQKDEQDMWWDIALRYDLENKLKKYPMMVFFGEVAGQVKRFRYDAELISNKLMTKLFCFDILDLKSNKYLNYDDTIKIFKELDLSAAPELYRGKWLDKETMYEFAEGTSTVGNCIREGFVLKCINDKYEPRLRGRLQLKLVSKSYNLSK